MKEIVDEVERWRQRGERFAVATVVATRMSTVRPSIAIENWPSWARCFSTMLSSA